MSEMPTRRRFFTAGAAVPLLAGSIAEAAPAPIGQYAHDENISLNGVWLFRLDPEGKVEPDWTLPDAPAAGWREVRVPHTWQV